MLSKNTQKEKYDLIVIGGGASGMMAAGVAAESGKRVLILEKNKELGKKLKITGGGRCNITNATFNIRELLSKFGKAEQFLYSAFSQFGVQDTFDFFESKNLPVVVEARNRVFPKSQKAMDVFRTMKKYITQGKVEVMLETPVRKINLDTYSKKIVSVKTKEGLFVADNYIIATGGASHPETGSTGDGLRWLSRDLGHTVQEPTPNIVPLRVYDDWVKKLSGKSLSFMKITFFVNDKKVFSETGKILFTHFGVSGPLILNLAGKVADLFYEGKVTAKVDCYPDTDHGSLEKSVLKVFDANKNKSFKNIAKEVVPKGMTDVIIEMLGIEPDIKVHSISKESRKELVHLLKAMTMEVEGLMGMDRAVVSDGGVDLKEVDMKNMRSKVIENLYLTGDILHINRPSGGYSLQLCWTTGFVAGKLQ